MKYDTTKYGLLAACLIAAAGASHAEPSAAKKDLIDKIIAAQQGGVENIARGVVQRPAAQMMQAVSTVLQTQVPADKREATAKTIEADVKKYVDESVPIMSTQAKKLAPSKLAPILDAKFSEAELKTLLAWLTSPVNRKFQEASPELEKALVEPMIAEAGPQIEPKLQALQQRTRATIQAAVGTPAAAAPASASASKPAGK